MRSQRLESTFRKLFAAGYDITSPETGHPSNPGSYNCIAWAASDTHHGFWWPGPDTHWPFRLEREENISCFVKAFRRLGYRECSNSRLEFGYEKVALYSIGDEPKHMARQLADGTWTSKLGGLEDIRHFTLDAVESFGPAPIYGEYGRPTLYMRRLLVVSWIVRTFQFAHWKIERLMGAI